MMPRPRDASAMGAAPVAFTHLALFALGPCATSCLPRAAKLTVGANFLVRDDRFNQHG